MLDILNENVANLINNKTILITGGTGTLGKKLTEIILNNFLPKKLIIFSRDEFKQYNMKNTFLKHKYSDCIRFLIGDVRDYERVLIATKNVDIIFHAAAMKQVDTIEYQPLEAIKTNINGTINIIQAAIQNKVEKVIGISTDKAVLPINLYGATKMCLEKLILNGNNLISDKEKTIFSILRYGNVINSRGSVVPLFLKQKNDKFTITDSKMTRFTLTIEQAVNFILNCASIMIGGEIFIPKLPSYNILQLAKCIDENTKIEFIGHRPGEKIHESMISCAESHKTLVLDNYYVISSDLINKDYHKLYGTTYLDKDYEYNSNQDLIDNEKLKYIINTIDIIDT